MTEPTTLEIQEERLKEERLNVISNYIATYSDIIASSTYE
jgi:hypothetical protein